MGNKSLYVFIAAAAFFISTQVFTPFLQTSLGINDQIEVPEPGNLTYASGNEWADYKQLQNIDIENGALTLQDSTQNGVWISQTVQGTDYIDILSLTSTVDYQGGGNNFTTVMRQSDNPSMSNATAVREINNEQGTFTYTDINSTQQRYFDILINISSGSSENSEYQYLQVDYENVNLSDVSVFLRMMFYAFSFLLAGTLLVLLVSLWD